MADFNLIDALHETTPSVEMEIKRDFISSLEAEKYDDVVGESVTKESYIPLLDDETKLPPSEADGKAVVHSYGETIPEQATNGRQLAERSEAGEQGPGKLPNGGGQADSTEMHYFPAGEEVLYFGNKHHEEGIVMNMISQSAQMSTESPFSVLDTMERPGAEEQLKFEPMRSPAHEMKSPTLSCHELHHLNSPTEGTEEPTFEESPEVTQLSFEEMASQQGEMLDTTLETRDSMAAVTAPLAFEEDLCGYQEEVTNSSMTLSPAEVESITDLEGNLQVKQLEQDLERVELPLTPSQQRMESAQETEDCSNPALSSAAIIDDHFLSKMMTTEVIVDAQVQAPTNNTLNAQQQENFGHGTETPVFTEPFPPSCRNIDTPTGLTSTTSSTVIPVTEASPLEPASEKGKSADEVREIAQAKESQVVKVAVEKKKKKKKRSHPKASQPVVDVPSKAKDVHRIISDQRLEELPSGGIQEHKEMVVNTEKSCKEMPGMKVKAQPSDNVPSAWTTGYAGEKMASVPLPNTKTSSEWPQSAGRESQRVEVALSKSASQVKSISEVEWTEHPLDSWSREISSPKFLQKCEVEEVLQPSSDKCSDETASCKFQEKAEMDRLALTSLELGDVEYAPPESRKAPELKEMEVPILEQVDPKTAPSETKQTPEAGEIVQIPLENTSREITVPELQKVEEVAQTNSQLEGVENASQELLLSSEVKEIAETLTENLDRETTSLEWKEVPEVAKEIANPCVENIVKQSTPSLPECMSEVKEMIENSVSGKVTPPESTETSEVNRTAEMPLHQMRGEIRSLDSQQMPVVDMSEMVIENVDTSPESNTLPEVKDADANSLELVARQTIPQQSEETSVETKLAESPSHCMYREADTLELAQQPDVKEVEKSPLQHGNEMGALEFEQSTEVKEIEHPLTKEPEIRESHQTLEVTEVIEHMNAETTLPDLQHTTEEKCALDEPSEFTPTETQQKTEVKEPTESPLECPSSETTAPKLQQRSEEIEKVEAPLECQTEVRASEGTGQVAPQSLKHEAPKQLDDNEEKGPKSPLRKGGAKPLQKRGPTKGISQKEIGVKVTSEQHRALKAPVHPKVTKAPNQRVGDGDDPLEPKEIGNVCAQADQGHLDKGPRPDEAKPKEAVTGVLTKTETAAVSKEHPATPDTKGKVGTLTTKTLTAKTKPQPSASLKRPTAAAPSPNKKPSTTTLTAATTFKRLPPSLARSSSATTKDVKPKATDAKGTMKPSPSRPQSAAVTKTPSNTSVKSSTTSLQKAAATAGSTPKNTLSTPRRPTSIKTEPKSGEMRKSLSAKSPLGETGRPKTTSTTSIKSSGTTPSSPSTPLGVNSPGTPSSNTTRAPRTLALKTTAASEAKRVVPIPRTPPKPTVAPAPKQPRPTSAPAPDLKNIKSKIGSTDNMKYQPGGGKAKSVEKKPEPVRLNRKVEPSTPIRVAKTTTAKDNQKQANGKVQILNKKVDYSHVQSKCGSKDNIKHMPGGGNVQIPKTKVVEPSRAASKCGSKTNLKHKAGSGDVKIESSKTDYKNKAESKIGSLDNLNHTPGGGNVKNEGEEESESATISQAPENGDLTGQAESGTQQNGVGVDPPAGSDETLSQELQMQETY
ncbi:microtubule-associated protein 4 isoform X3 [Amblyraja radiata]|uniref:microtubule-associated protein 4 isoform X3 n=1 Tax=Amblyraja radiata TaxID=386614 RepID=UPI00140335A6|nr:microtubule-associated protein 4 isoform X3 [Amblyraja radiata]